MRERLERSEPLSPETQSRILVLDDDETMRSAMARLLARRGYEVHVTATGAQALALLAQSDYHLLYCDVLLDQDSGVALVPTMRALYPALSVVMYTGLDDARMPVEALRAGPVDYVTKPMSAAELYATTERTIASRPAVRARRSSGSIAALSRTEGARGHGSTEPLVLSRHFEAHSQGEAAGGIGQLDVALNKLADVLAAWSTAVPAAGDSRAPAEASAGERRPRLASSDPTGGPMPLFVVPSRRPRSLRHRFHLWMANVLGLPASLRR